MKRQTTQNGYSILELLIYIAMVSMLSIILVQSLVTVMRTYSTAQAYRRLQNNGELVMERLTREARNATSITTGTYGTHPGSITFSGTDDSGVTRTVSFAVVNGLVQITVNGTSAPISTNEVAVTSLIFQRIATTAGSGIKIELILTTASGHIVSAPFYSTIMLRGK